ncbi:MAG: hypothetical protein V3S30_01440 [Thermoanaerobaculia bacterium]
MSNDRIFRRLALLALTVASISLFAACKPRVTKCPDCPPPPAPRAPMSHANIKYLGVSDACAAATACVDVPDTISLWKANGQNGGKPKKARWWVDNSQKKQYYWEITYKGAGDDLLGPVSPIGCTGPQNTRSGSTNQDPNQDSVWEYQVTVWSCKDGDKDPDGCLCKTDPRIAIHR